MKLDMQIDIKVEDKEFRGTTRSVLLVNEANLNQEFIEQPSTFAWFATLAEIANAEVSSKELALEVLKANLEGELRQRLAELGGKVTEKMIEGGVITDKRYKVATEELIDSTKQLGILKSMVKALDQRKDMLIQLGSMKRQEMFLDGSGLDLKKIREHNQ